MGSELRRKKGGGIADNWRKDILRDHMSSGKKFG